MTEFLFMKLHGNNKKKLCSSAGPRVCPGEVLVQRESFLFLAQILQHYHLVPPKGISPESMPTTIRYEAGGILVSDFDVVFSPRID